MGCRRLLEVLAVTGVLTLRAYAAPATQPATVADRVAALLQQLDSDSYQDRAAAAEAGMQLPVEALPLLKEAEQKPGVSPEVRSQLATIVQALQQAAGKQSKYQSYLAFYQHYLTGEYDRVGKKDPRWDDAAHKYLEAAAQRFADEVDDRENDINLTALIAPLKASPCDDPMLQYQMMRYGSTQRNSGAIDALCSAILASPYSDLRKQGVLLWAARSYPLNMKDPKSVERVRGYLKQSVELWPTALKAAADLPKDIALMWMCELVETDPPHVYSRKEIWEMLDAALAKIEPEESLDRLNLKGSFLIKYAWDARGGGWSNTVTADGWKQFAERLTEADKVFTRCYELFPDNPHAATQMLTVELGQGQGRPRLELWFDRAMKADPGNIAACRAKMWYLAPRWYGSQQEQLAFGRECLARAQFDSRVPLMVVAAHRDCAPGEPWASIVPQPYYAREEVWSDLSAAYDGYLLQQPTADRTRASYARFAYEAGKWKEALAIYAVLDAEPATSHDDPMPRLMKAEATLRLAAAGKPVVDRTARAAARQRANTEAFKKLTLGAYEKVGKKDPKWDAAARAALLASAQTWGGDPDRNFSEHDTMLESSKQAIDAGCDDPLIKFIYSNSVDSYLTPRDAKFVPIGLDDGDALARSQYPAFLRLRGPMWAGSFLRQKAETDDKARARAWASMDLAIDALPASVADHALDEQVVRSEVNELLSCALSLGEESNALWARAKANLEAGHCDPLMLRKIAARFHVAAAGYAFPKNGSKPYTPQQQKTYAAAMIESEKETEAIWRDDPDDPFAAHLMIYVCRGLHTSRERLDFWFRQAIVNDPADRTVTAAYLDALTAISQYREPIGVFAEQCAGMADYRSQIPFLQVLYLDRLALQGKKPEDKPDGTILGTDQNWPRIAAVYEAYLARYPLDTDRRSEYCSYTCLVGRWQVAAEQFKILDKRVKPKAFYSQERLEACRQHVVDLMGKGFLASP